MEINSQSQSLFDYINGGSQSNTDLQSIVDNQAKDIRGSFDVLESGLSTGQFEETFALLEAGEVDIDLPTVENYYEFNKSRLDKEIAQLADRFNFDSEVKITLQDGSLVVEGDSKSTEALQQYIDKDSRLATLLQQTSKLSQFVEWGQAKEQATEYQANDVPEEELVSFLKEARSVITQPNEFILSDKGSGFASQGHTQYLIDAIADRKEAEES